MKNILLSLVFLVSSFIAFSSEQMLIMENQADLETLLLLANRQPSPFIWGALEQESNDQLYIQTESGSIGNQRSATDKVYEFKDKYLPIYAFIFHRKNTETNPSSDVIYERCLYPKKYSKEQIVACVKKIDKKFTINNLQNWFVNFRSRCTRDSNSEEFQDWFLQLQQEYSNSQLNKYTYKSLPATGFQRIRKWVSNNGIPSSLEEKIRIANKFGLTKKQGLNFYYNFRKRSGKV